MRYCRFLIALSCAVSLVGCATPTTPRYTASAQTANLIKNNIKNSVNFGKFTQPPKFDTSCRTSANLILADGLTHAEYIQRAFKEEFILSGMYSKTALITLTADVSELEFSTISGYWKIATTIHSTNGKQLSIAKIYNFIPGAYWETACRNAADAYQNAVRDMISEAVINDAFADLIK